MGKNHKNPNNFLSGNEDLTELKRKLEDIFDEEVDPAKRPVLTNQDIAGALWSLADEIEELQSLRKHRHAARTIEVVET